MTEEAKAPRRMHRAIREAAANWERNAFDEYMASLTPIGRYLVRHGWEPRRPMVPWGSQGRADYFERSSDARVYWRRMNLARKAAQPVWRRRAWRVLNGAWTGVQMLALLAFGLLILAAMSGNIAYFGRVILTGQP